MFRFRLRTLMLLFVLVALVAPVLYDQFQQRRVESVGFSKAELARRLSGDQPILVLFHARWNSQSDNQLSAASDTIWHIVRDNSISVLDADCTTKGSPGDRLMQQIGITRLPAFALYSPSDPLSPIIHDQLASESNLRFALKRISLATTTTPSEQPK